MDPINLSTFLLLGLGGFFAGLIDSIAGGGGLVSLPILLSVGFPPHLALGTNKLQGTFGTLTSTLNYARFELVDVKEAMRGVIFTAVGASLGTITIQFLSAGFLHQIIPILLTGIFLYMLFSPRIGERDRITRFSPSVFYGLFGLILGFYDGFFGPGTGSLWMVAFALFLGINLKKATAHTKLMNLTSNLVALICFAWGGHVVVSAGIVMGVGQVAGAFTGSSLVATRGVAFVRWFFIGVVGLTILKLVVSTYLQ